MPTTTHTALPTISTSTSSRTSSAIPSTQASEHVFTSPATSNPSSSAPLSDSDDDLSDAPESPIDPEQLPASSMSSSLSCGAPHSDSDSDLSDAPNSPIWPEGPETAPHASLCTEHDCPMRQIFRRHYRGRYLHNGERPRMKGTDFGESNPPPFVWESWMKIQAGGRNSTVEDDWNYLGFLRWHVDLPNTSLTRK